MVQLLNFTPTQVCFYGSNHSDEPIFEHRIGIQVYYTVGGVKNASDIVYINAGDLEPAVPANPWPACATITLQDRRWHSPAA